MSAVRVGFADSGVNPRHPQVGGVAGGADFRLREGRIEIGTDFEDRLGHGTAVAATIRGHAPSAELYALRVFRRRLATHPDVVVAAIDWAIENRLHVLNLSFAVEIGQGALADAALRARRAGLIPVYAAEVELPWGIGVLSDPSLGEEEFCWTASEGRKLLVASTWARKIPGLPRERNFQGRSFAIAHATGLTVRSLRVLQKARSRDSLIDVLVELWGLPLHPPDGSQLGD